MGATKEQPGQSGMEILAGTVPPPPEAMLEKMNSSALFNPCGLAVSLDGRIYIADTGHHRICVLEDGVLSVLAGTGARGCADGRGCEAMFAHPCGLAISPEGYLFVADCGNHRIRQVSPDGDVSTLAGSGQPAHKDGHGRFASFYNPCGIAIDYLSHDVLYVADYSNNCIRAVSRSGLVSTLAKDAEAPLDSPYGIAVHMEYCQSGGTEATLYVSSYHSHSVHSISPEGHVQVRAGCGAPRHVDDVGTSAGFHAPNGLATDADGNLYIADSGNHSIRCMAPDGTVTTLAGDGSASFSPSSLNSPCGLAVCSLPGRGPVILIADRSNSCVRWLAVDALPPPCMPPSTLREDLSAMLDCDSDCLYGEAVFEVSGRVLRAPKAVLCARCPHFKAMFASGMREARGDPVEVCGVSYEVYRALLDYLLCDVLKETLEPHNTLELMMLANAYGVERLEQLCARQLITTLSVSNVHEVGRCAEMIGSGHLARAAEKFVRSCAVEMRCADEPSRAADDPHCAAIVMSCDA